MKACSFKNPVTSEPKVYFRSDSDIITDRYSEALKHSSESLEIGFRDSSGNFVKAGEQKVMSPDTIEGRIQNYIKNDYLRGEVDENGYFQATDTIAAEMLEEELVIKDPFGYERIGNKFKFGDFTPKGNKGMVSEYAVKGMMKLLEISSNKKPRTLKYSPEELVSKINDFMVKMGYSTTSIEEYKSKYKIKHGVEPNAEAFIDFQNKVIAFRNGEITLDTMTEEFAHFVIEGLNQQQVDAMLDFVPNTQEYARYAEQYRAIYAKHFSDPAAVEKAVRKEVLGKMLAASLQKNFNTQNRNSTERNIFDRLLNMLSDFLEYLTNKLDNSNELQRQLDDLSKEIENRLYNDTLNDIISEDVGSSIGYLMYSVGNPNIDPEYNQMMGFINALQGLNRRIHADPTNLNVLTQAETTLSALEDNTKGILDNLVNKQVISPIERQNLSSQINQLKGNIRGSIDSAKNKSAEQVFKELMPEVAGHLSEELQENIKNDVNIGVNALQKDTNKIAAYISPMDRFSNIFTQLLSKITARMITLYQVNLEKDVMKFVAPLTKHVKLLNSFMKSNGDVLSGIDTERLYNDKRKQEYDHLKDLGYFVNMGKSNATLEDYIEMYEQNMGLPMKTSDPYYYALQIRLFNDPLGGDRSHPVTRAIDIALKHGFTLKELQDPLLTPAPIKNVIERLNSTKNRYGFDLVVDVDSTDLESMTWAQAQARIRKGEISLDNVFSTRANIDFKNRLPQPSDVVFLFKGKKGTKAMDSFLSSKLQSELYDTYDKSDKGFKSARKAFKEYEKSLVSQGLSKAEIAKKKAEWFKKNFFIVPNDNYYQNVNFPTINFERFYLFEKDPQIRADIGKMEVAIKKLQEQKRQIVSKYRNPNNYLEVDTTHITQIDLSMLQNIDEDAKTIMKNISKEFDRHDLELYTNTGNFGSVVYLNDSLSNDFRDKMGISFDDASVDEVLHYFKNSPFISTSVYDRLTITVKKLKDEYAYEIANQANDPDGYQRYLDATKQEIMKSLPSYTKRTYGSEQVYRLMGDIIANEAYDQMFDDYENKVGIFTSHDIRTPLSFTFGADAQMFAETYQNIDNSTYSNLKEKYRLLKEFAMSKDGNLSKYENREMDNILKDENKLRVYIQMMDAQVQRLVKDDFVRPEYLFTLAQVRANEYENIKGMVKGERTAKDLIKQKLSEYSFMPEEMEDSYKDKIIPRRGYIRLPKGQVSNDVLYMLTSGLDFANNYQQRVKHINLALSAKVGLENQSFDGKLATDTNYHKAMMEHIDSFYYGRSVSHRLQFEIGGRKVDFTKVANKLRTFSVKVGLGLSPVVALVNYTSASVMKGIEYLTENNLHRASDRRATKELLKIGFDPKLFSDIESINPNSKVMKIYSKFGNRNFRDIMMNSDASKLMKLMPEAAFSMMQATSFPMEMQVLMSKLMEHRLIDGKFIGWRQFLTEKKTENPSLTEAQIKAEFDKHSDKSMYDYLGNNVDFDIKKLEKDGFKGDIMEEQSRVTTDFLRVNETIMMQLAKFNESEITRHPLMSFVTTLKKWMIITNSLLFAKETVNLTTGSIEKGMLHSVPAFKDLFDAVFKGGKSWSEAFNSLSEVDRKNIQRMGYTSASIAILFVLSSILLAYADDEENEDNYALQMATILAVRTLNETNSSFLTGFHNSILGMVNSPVTAISTVKSLAEASWVFDYDETLKRGNNAGYNKQLMDMLKVTMFKNMWNLRDAETLKKVRSQYIYFNTKDNIAELLNLLEVVKEEEDEK